MKYKSRQKEAIYYVCHHTHLDGHLEIGEPTKGPIQWVYKREDGSEFVGLKAQSEVYRIDKLPHVDTYVKSIKAISIRDLLPRLDGMVPVDLRNGLVGFVKPDPESKS